LVALRQVRIEVILARKDTALVDGATQRLRSERCELDRLPVQHGQRSGKSETDGADVRVRLAAVLVPAAAEGLRLRQQLNVDLESNDGLVFSDHLGCKTGKSRHRRILSTLVRAWLRHWLCRGLNWRLHDSSVRSRAARGP